LKRRVRIVLGTSLLLAPLAASLLGCITAPRHHGPPSDHFDGETFKNVDPFEERGLFDIIKWRLTSEAEAWDAWVDLPKQPKPPARVESGVRITFVNHATVLVQIAGLNILTDPIWSETTGPFSLGPRRHKAPGIAFEDLPPIDLVVISHNHWDHLDMPTIARLAERDPIVVFAGLGTAKLFPKSGVKVRAVDLDWWESKTINGVRIRFAPAQHWSTRALVDRNFNLWGSWYFESDHHRVYFAGDTGAGSHFAAIKARYGAPDLALIPIGAYAPRWFMRSQHLDPVDAVEAHRALGAKQSVAIHWGTFQQTDESMVAPRDELEAALEAAALPPETFVALENGESVSLR
jgi:L-ascorbate metabolism protein UlaG (beta-lactamase superfamily)